MNDRRAPAEAREIVILTGMSGAGRSTAAHAMEDLGWYVVDNLPPQMLAPLIELTSESSGGRTPMTRVAAVVDARSGDFFTAFQAALRELRDGGYVPRMVFIDANDESLVRRFESVRRPHPLQGDGRLLDGILRERQLLSDVRSEADLVVDTSGLNVQDRKSVV